jgi:AcrR family transcriptional regulator
MAAKRRARSQKERRVAKVLDAAEALFAAHGYEATLISEIAETASVAPATIYNYFSTKPNLLMNLALRHVHAALPERRTFLKNLPEDPLEGIEAFERLLAEQALRHLSRECWRTLIAAQVIEPRGRAGRTGARLNSLIKRQYVQIILTYQARQRIAPDIDPNTLSDLIVGVATMNFARFIAGPGGTVEDLLRLGLPHIALILRSLLVDKRPKGHKLTKME